MITKSNSMIFEPVSDELIELDLNSNDYNPHGACAVYFKNQIVMIGGSQNGARVAIVKDCEFQILDFKLPYEVEYHSCAVRYYLGAGLSGFISGNRDIDQNFSQNAIFSCGGWNQRKKCFNIQV